MTKKNFTEVEASEVYGPSVAWFRRKRWEGNGPQFIKLPGMVLYPVEELENYFSSRLRKSTSDPGPAVKTAQTGKEHSKLTRIGKGKQAPSAGSASSQGQGGGHE